MTSVLLFRSDAPVTWHPEYAAYMTSDLLFRSDAPVTWHPEYAAYMTSVLLFRSDAPVTWHPEYAAYMIEGTPGKPYGHLMAHFNNVEANMKLR